MPPRSVPRVAPSIRDLLDSYLLCTIMVFSPMTVSALLFIVLFFATLGTLGSSAAAAFRGRRRRALTILRLLVLSLAVYMVVVVLVSFFTPQRFRDIGKDQCADDWCIAVARV